MRTRHPLGLPARTAILAGASAFGGGFLVWAGSGFGLFGLFLIATATFLAGLGGWWVGRLHSRTLRQLAANMRETTPAHPEPRTGPVAPEMTALREAWAAAQARTEAVFSAQKDFTANAAHELKTPLAALRVAGETALMGSPDRAGLSEAVGSMLEEADRVTALVDRLLLLARAESGRIPVEADYLLAGKVVREVHELLQPLAEERGQTLRIDEEDAWSVWADPGLLRLALENLVGNAIRHTPRGGHIRLSVRRLPEGGVALEVADDGPGIPASESARIFERFFRGRGAGASGSGLGLPLARWAVEAFGGTLTLLAGESPGARFRIRCPETEWDHFSANPAAPAAEPTDPPEADWLRAAEPAQVLARLASQRRGLDATEVARRLAICGPNELEFRRGPGRRELAWRALRTPFNGILSLCIALSLALGEWRPALVMSLMVALSSALRFWQESRSHRAVSRLEDLVAVEALVARPDRNAPTRVDVDELVPGDVVHLNPGDMVPADLRLIAASGLRVTEASLTGETFPVAKTSRALPAATPSSSEAADNLCFLGTHVAAGSGIGVVSATGKNTLLGRRARDLGRDSPSTFDEGVRRVSLLLLGFMAILVPVVFLINGTLKGDWTDALLFALAVAVGLTPELLPVIVNVNLARAARLLARRGLIIKDLRAVQAFGAFDVLCVDKTGTLTRNEPRLAAALDPAGQPDDRLIPLAWLAARHEPSSAGPLDDALLRRGDELLSEAARSASRRLASVPFDHERRRVSVLVRTRPEATPRLICKGAPESVLANCTHHRQPGPPDAPPALLDEPARQRLDAHLRSLLAGGTRVLALATREAPSGDSAHLSPADETRLCFEGFLAFEDAIRPDAAPAIAHLTEAGVTVKILTGDHPATARAAARAVGLPTDHPVLTGERLRALPEVELRAAAARTTVFARLHPTDKARLVRVLREQGHRVGFLGEGANDANALRAADVGIAAAHAAPLARDCAQVVLARDSLHLLADGVRQGRQAFGNILKYIKITASSNFGNAFSVVLASVLLPFLPMRAVQLVTQNLLYDLAQLFLPWDRVDADFTQKPRTWSADSIGRFMLVFGPLSSVFDLLTFAVLWYGFGANSVASQGLFQTGWFVVGLTTQLVILHILRTGRLPFVHSRATVPVVVATLLAAAAGLALPFSPLAPWFGFEPLPPAFLLWVVAVVIAYALAAELTKRLYLRHQRGWL
ncbi:MAG: magnesium-translocating P-type ATPase [Opitutales bacterium]|nr:magnesium-translocating P-type ATPase [Opitutales bacterium]